MAKILVVDDAAFMRKTLKDILIKGGHEVVGEAQNTDEALSQFERLKPDLVTMDIVMMGENGIEAVTKLLQKIPGAKVLMVSAMGQQALIVESIKVGAKGFIIKPFKADQVLAEVERIVH